MLLGMIGSTLPEDHRSTLNQLSLFNRTGDFTLLPTAQKLSSLHRYLVRHFADENSAFFSLEQRVIVDTGICFPGGIFPETQRSDAIVVRTLSEWVEDFRSAVKGEDRSNALLQADRALSSAESRVKRIASRISMMFPLLTTTLGSVAADGRIVVLTKDRARMLTDYLLESVRIVARAAMRFREPYEEEPGEEGGSRHCKERRRIAAFPKLMDGIHRLKRISNEEDGSDLIVERLLLSIDSLFLESLLVCAFSKGIAEASRRIKLFRQYAENAPLPAQALPELLKKELDRMYAVVERAAKSLPGETEHGGYSPVVIPEPEPQIIEHEELREGGDDQNLFLSQKKTDSGPPERSFANSFFDIIAVDRGLLSIPKVRFRGFPGILLFPGNAVGAYDKVGDLLLVPHSALNNRPLDALLPAFASFRWLSDDSGKTLNMWGDIAGGRGARRMPELEASFREAYCSWVKSELEGGEAVDAAKSLGASLKEDGGFARLFG